MLDFNSGCFTKHRSKTDTPNELQLRGFEQEIWDLFVVMQSEEVLTVNKELKYP